MFEVTYLIETPSGKQKIEKRLFHDQDMADSEVNFQPGMVLNNGDVIKKVSMKKAKK